MASTTPFYYFYHINHHSSKRSYISFKGNSTRIKILPITLASSPLLHAANHTVDTYVKSGMVIGLGSGQASGMAIQYLGQQLRAGALKHITGIPTSVSSASEAAKAGIPLGHYQDSYQIDFAFDDADIIEEGTLIAVIGRQRLQGEESIIQEKSILNAADQLVFMITENQYKGGPDGSIPVLVQSLNWMETAEEIDDLFVGDAEVWRRSSIGQASPLGGDFPLVTREGHNILDVIFTSPIESLAEVANSLDKIDGVVDHGVVSKCPCRGDITFFWTTCSIDAKWLLLQKADCALLIMWQQMQWRDFNRNSWQHRLLWLSGIVPAHKLPVKINTNKVRKMRKKKNTEKGYWLQSSAFN